ncbi:MAG: aspartyl/asparaginyl beta-hydroxylase domain-containing protein [Roseobacter sp.]
MLDATTTPARKKPVNSWLVRWGKRQRKWVNPYIKRYSKIEDAAVFNRSDFPWIDALEAEWEAIRDEALTVLRNREAIPPLAEISPDHKGLDNLDKWRSFFLWGYGFRVDANCKRCPRTSAALAHVPGLRTAMYSIHAPGMAIPPHKGVTAGMCVFHMGLKVPRDTDNCAIRVDDQIVHWRDGEAFVFDDTRQHETWNRTDDERVILLIQFDRPVRFPGNIVAVLFFQAIRRSSFVGTARRRLGNWEETFRQFEKTDE